MKLRQVPTTCDFKECNCAPTKQILLSLAAHGNHEPAVSTPIAFTCDKHALEFTFDAFVNTGNNWQNICNQFLAIGRMEPKKEFSKVIVQDIYDETKN